MTEDDEFNFDIQACIDCGLMEQIGEDKFGLTEAGKDYVEMVLASKVSEPMQAYALGRLQGLRESEATS